MPEDCVFEVVDENGNDAVKMVCVNDELGERTETKLVLAVDDDEETSSWKSLVEAIVCTAKTPEENCWGWKYSHMDGEYWASVEDQFMRDAQNDLERDLGEFGKWLVETGDFGLKLGKNAGIILNWLNTADDRLQWELMEGSAKLWTEASSVAKDLWKYTWDNQAETWKFEGNVDGSYLIHSDDFVELETVLANGGSGINVGNDGSGNGKIGIEVNDNDTNYSTVSIDKSSVSNKFTHSTNGVTKSLIEDDLIREYMPSSSGKKVYNIDEDDVMSLKSLSQTYQVETHTSAEYIGYDYGYWSDARLKEDIRDLPESKIMQLKPRIFTQKGEERAFLVADEVAEVFPNAVKVAENGLRGMSIKEIIAHLVKHNQELEGRLAALEA